MAKRALLCIFVTASILTAQDEKKVKLEIRAKKGDTVKTEETFSNEGTMVITVGELEQEMEMSKSSTFEYTDEVLEVDEEGWPTKVKRAITKWRKSEQEPMQGEPVEKKMSLEGETITLVRKGKKTELEDAPEDLPREEEKKNTLRRPVFVSGLPGKEVAVGESWEIPEKKIIEEFAQEMDDDNATLTSAKGKATLKSLTPGEPTVAEVVYEFKLKGKLNEEADITISANFTLKIDTDNSRMLTLTGGGKIELAGKVDQGGQEMELDGDFEIKGTTKNTYK